jgi:hypothetical protein
MSVHAISWVLKHSDATLGARLVLISLADHAHDDGSHAFPSVDTLVKETRMTRRAVQAALRKLEAAGDIVNTSTMKSGTREYAIAGVRRGEESSRGEVSTRVEDARRGVVDDTQRRTSFAQTVRKRQEPSGERLRDAAPDEERDLSYLNATVIE